MARHNELAYKRYRTNETGRCVYMSGKWRNKEPEWLHVASNGTEKRRRNKQQKHWIEFSFC